MYFPDKNGPLVEALEGDHEVEIRPIRTLMTFSHLCGEAESGRRDAHEVYRGHLLDEACQKLRHFVQQ